MNGVIVGWKLIESERDDLLKRFPPRYSRVIADHVTLRFGTSESTPLPIEEVGEIIGISDDDHGVQALIVRIGNTTDRGDGSHFHITWSLDEGRQARESNDVIALHGWTGLAATTAVRLLSATWPR